MRGESGRPLQARCALRTSKSMPCSRCKGREKEERTFGLLVEGFVSSLFADQAITLIGGGDQRQLSELRSVILESMSGSDSKLIEFNDLGPDQNETNGCHPRREIGRSLSHLIDESSLVIFDPDPNDPCFDISLLLERLDRSHGVCLFRCDRNSQVHDLAYQYETVRRSPRMTRFQSIMAPCHHAILVDRRMPPRLQFRNDLEATE